MAVLRAAYNPICIVHIHTCTWYNQFVQSLQINFRLKNFCRILFGSLYCMSSECIQSLYFCFHFHHTTVADRQKTFVVFVEACRRSILLFNVYFIDFSIFKSKQMYILKRLTFIQEQQMQIQYIQSFFVEYKKIIQFVYLLIQVS